MFFINRRIVTISEKAKMHEFIIDYMAIEIRDFRFEPRTIEMRGGEGKERKRASTDSPS